MPTCTGMLMALVYTFIMNLRCCLYFQYHSTDKGIYRHENQYLVPGTGVPE